MRGRRIEMLLNFDKICEILKRRNWASGDLSSPTSKVTPPLSARRREAAARAAKKKNFIIDLEPRRNLGECGKSLQNFCQISAKSSQNFASNIAFFSIFQNLQDFTTFCKNSAKILQFFQNFAFFSESFQKFLKIFAKFREIYSNFVQFCKFAREKLIFL